MTATDRLLVLAPRGRDAQVIVGQLQGLQPAAMIATPSEILDTIRTGDLGAAVVTDEALANFDLASLSAALAAQPPWSDSPFIVLTQRQFGGWTRVGLANLLGNHTILERPLRGDVLISSVRSALRARARQRRAQGHLLAVEAADAQVRELAATLEARVHERTAALTRAMAETAETQRRLRDSEALYRYTVELTEQAPWTADPSGRILSLGRGWANPTGTIRNWRRLVHEDDLSETTAMWAASIAAGTSFLADFRLRRADGRYIWCRSRAAPRRVADGSVERWYGTLYDIDEQRLAAVKLRQTQAELIHVSRLSAMGAMASTLAHELNQPLTAIANYVRGSRRMLGDRPDCEPISNALELADRSAVRAGAIVRKVRELVTKGEVQFQAEDVTALVREACSIAMIDAPSSGIDLILDLTTGPIEVMVDRVQIQQILLNFLRNAAEAVAGRPQRRITVTTLMPSQDVCEVAVSDTGPGVSASAADRLFEPFNTSKSNGMGIGLSISRTIVEAHGGTIWHRRNSSGGAMFGFSLRTSGGATTVPQTPALAESDD